MWHERFTEKCSPGKCIIKNTNGRSAVWQNVWCVMQHWYRGIFKSKLCKPLKNYPDWYKQVVNPEFVSKQIWVGETKLLMWKIIYPVSKSTTLWNPVPAIPSGHHRPAIFLSSNKGLCTTDTASSPKQNFYYIHIVILWKDKKSK